VDERGSGGPSSAAIVGMPRLIVPEGRTATLVNAINYLLSRDGASGLSLRAIARESRVSTSSMLHHFGSREHFHVAAAWTGRARVQVIESRAQHEAVAAFLPQDDDEEDLITARAWLAWCELWRCESAVRAAITGIRDEEHTLLARILQVPLRTQGLVPVMALIDGLLVAVCAPDRPLSPTRARELLLGHVAAEPSFAHA
jgi:AcrR family transcriptional regulator